MLDKISSRSPFEDKPMDQCGPMGIQASNPIHPNPRVFMARSNNSFIQGHTAHSTLECCNSTVYKILDYYEETY